MEIDTTELGIEDVIARIEELVRARRGCRDGLRRLRLEDLAALDLAAHVLPRARAAPTGSSGSRARAAACSRSTTWRGSTSRSSARSRRGTSTTSRRSSCRHVPGVRAASSTGTGSSPSAAASPTATRSARCVEYAARRPRDRPVRRGDAAEGDGAARARAAGRGDGRDPGGRPGRADRASTARSSGSSGTSPPARSRSASRSGSRVSPKGGKGYKEASAGDRAPPQRPLRLARRRARARAAARG